MAKYARVSESINGVESKIYNCLEDLAISNPISEDDLIYSLRRVSGHTLAKIRKQLQKRDVLAEIQAERERIKYIRANIARLRKSSP